MKLKAAMEPDFELVIDRPFIFIIRETGTGALLFVGRVLSPTGGGG
jgi:serine protease inhibitor